MIKTFSYRIKDAKTSATLERMARSVNVVWNFCNETQLNALRWNKRWPNYATLCELTAGSAQALGLHSQTVQAACQEYEARRRAARKAKLRWRGKRSLGWVPFKKVGVKVNSSTVRYGNETFRYWRSRPIEGTLKTGSFSQDARGRWYVNFQCEVEATKLRRDSGSHRSGKSIALPDAYPLCNGACWVHLCPTYSGVPA